MVLQNTSKLSISFNGPLMGVGTDCGYGYAAVQLIEAWNNLGIPVWWGKEECPIAFSFGQPEWYTWQSDSQYKIGYTPWESTKLPFGWSAKMNRMDEIWTTSNACKEWFIQNGVKVPVRVLHHGINREHYKPRRRVIGDGESFRFLHIGEPAPRKGGELVLQAFIDAFGNSKNHSLTLKGACRFPIPANIKNIRLIPERYTQAELLQLYYNHHAFIYPTNGEGFGFLPFDAAATGMPSFVTDWGGSKDYMNSCLPISCKGLIPCSYEPHEGSWANPSLESVILNMQEVSESPTYFFERAYKKAVQMPNKWDWKIFGKLSAGWMNEALQ